MTLELLFVSNIVTFIFWEGFRCTYTAMTNKEPCLEFGAIV